MLRENLKLICPQLYYNIVVCCECAGRRFSAHFWRLLLKFRSWPFLLRHKGTLWSSSGLLQDSSAIMSEKPEKVYQGVRVKWTVKDMLKFYREKAASGAKLKTAYLEMKELYASSVPGVLLDPPPAPAPADTPSCAGAAAAAPQVPESIPRPPCAFGGVPPPFGEALVSSFDPRTADFCGPPPCSPPPWSHGLSSDVDFYGHGVMRERQAPCPPLDPLTLCASSDLHSFSPQDSFSSSSSSSSCFDSPPRMGPCFHADFYHYPHFEPPQDCEAACWQQESLPAPEYTTYYPPTDYPYICPPEDPYWRRD
ncbi:hypothetical protein FQA47_020349 [Oryzias melastigma]|uniref:OCA domain-containing protein n=1 Tax=Oryzias melastigma TaxID=30732 RepID=A0A834C6U7_ORYME|nr:hypothetical protein FQA47_020349 [Oryzias melastigma]